MLSTSMAPLLTARLNGFRLAISTDLLIFIVPIPAIWPLKLPRRQKVVLVGIFTIGFLSVYPVLPRLAMT